jgi:hypothetical protein
MSDKPYDEGDKTQVLTAEDLAALDTNIPVLEDVIDPETEAADDSAITPDLVRKAVAVELPKLAPLSEELRQQVEQDYAEITERVTAAVMKEIEGQVRAEINRTLVARLEALIDKTLDPSSKSNL